MTTTIGSLARRITAHDPTPLVSPPNDRLVSRDGDTEAAAARRGEDYQTSLLRCQYAEKCRQSDSAQTSASWRRQFLTQLPDRLRQVFRFVAWARDAAVGSVRTLGSVPDMAKLCDQADIVSFDVFDTLLYRTVEPPDYLKRLAANFAADRYATRGYPVTPDLFLYLRNVSEMRQRRLAQSGGADAECKLSEVIHEVLLRLFGTEQADSDTELLVRYEVDLELQHLRVAEGIPQLLQQLKARGKRIIASSDTYLERAHLQQLFTQLQLNRWIDVVYPSSEYGVGKYSGRLFQEILKTEAIQPRCLIHVGDTYESDIRGALKSGVSAVFLFDIERLRRRREIARKFTQRSAPASVAPQKAGPMTAPNQLAPISMVKQPELYRIGHDILGPAFTAFILQVIQEAARIGAADIYYLAREGHLFRRLHELLIARFPALKKQFQSRYRYLYVSRLATSLPAVRTLSLRELHLAFYRNRHSTLAECIAAFGLDAADFADLGIEFENRNEMAKADLFRDREFASRVQARAQEARTLLRGYMAQEGFFRPEQVKLLVDIGWNATIQANLTRAFDDDPEFPLVVGHYFGRKYRHEDYSLSARSLFMPGCLFDEKRLVRAEQAIGHCLELFELAAAAPHGATLGYDVVDGQVTPMLSKEGGELSQEQGLLQAGILDYAASFVCHHSTDGFDLATLRSEALRGLAPLLLRPTAAQAEALKNLSHSLDWGSSRCRPLVSSQISPLLVFTPRRFYDALKESYWLEGCMRVSRIPGALVGLSIARRVLRIRSLFARLRSITNHYFRSNSVAS